MTSQTLPTPIRVGIVGLSSKPDTWAVRAHLPFLQQSANFEIVAVCNTSLASSHAAIQAHGLDVNKSSSSTTWAYATPEEMAQDPYIDLFVVCTRVDRHYAALLPALKSNIKAIFVEWPLASNRAQARELLDLAGCRYDSDIKRTMVGLQGRVSPAVRKIKTIVDSGRLGIIHSANVSSASNIIRTHDNSVDENLSFIMDRRVGGNPLTVYGGHILDSVFFALGEPQSGTATAGNVQTMAGNLMPRLKVRKADDMISLINHMKEGLDESGVNDDDDNDDGDGDGKQWHQKTTPDQIMLQARLDRTPPAMLSFHLRAGEPSPIDGPGTVWTIYGAKAELRVEWAGPGPHNSRATLMRISDYDGRRGVEDVELDDDEDDGGVKMDLLPGPAQNVGRLYNAFLRGAGGGYADWEVALRRQELLEGFYNNMQ